MSKLIKKVLIVTFGIALVFSLTACDYGHTLYVRPDKTSIGVELIYYNNPDAKSNPQEKYPFDFDKLEVIKTLNTAEIESFLDELSQIGGLGGKPRRILHSPNGIGIRIFYEDGNFDLVTFSAVDGQGNQYGFANRLFVAEYTSDGSIVKSNDVDGSFEEAFKTLINKYFDTQI